MDNKICETIKELRKRRGISQDVLAAALEISVQAVSKWETGNSLPDILLLPRIAEFFGITIDNLFFGIPEEENLSFGDIEGIKEDGVLRIVQFLGTKCLGHEDWQKDKPITLELQSIDHNFNMEVWGSANVTGNIKGYLEAEGGVNCGDINGYLEAEGGVNCGNVGSYVEAEGGVNCGNIGAYVEAEGNVSCGNVGSYIEAEGDVSCGNVNGYLETEGDVTCGEIHCEGDIECQNLYCKGDITCNSIDGEVHREGSIVFR